MKLFHKILFALILFTCVTCDNNDDSIYFNWEIKQIEDKIQKEKVVTLIPLQLKGTNHGFMSVYDSLIFFMNPKLPNHFFNVFNVDTNEEVGVFVERGQGPNEFTAVGPIFQFYKESDDGLKTLLFAPNEESLLIWNIDETIKQRKTIIDTIITYTWNEETKGANYKNLFRFNEKELLLGVQSHMIDDKTISLPFYQKRTIYTNKPITNYQIYNKAISNDESTIIMESFFASNDSFKPDGTKVLLAMLHLPQLNILDIKKREVTGYRMKGGEDFSVFKKKNKILKNYFVRVVTDNRFIYASYWGKDMWGGKEIPYINSIYVYNWSGVLVQKIATDRAIGEMALDRVKNRLYTMDASTDEVFYLDLDGLLD